MLRFLPAASAAAFLYPLMLAPALAQSEPGADECESGLLGDLGGVRQDLYERGIAFGLTATFQTNRVLTGGLHNGLTAHALYDLNGTFDLGKLAGIEDATLFFDAYFIDGHNPSQDAGDAQWFSDIAGPRRVAQVAEVYYEQWFLDRSLRVKLGKMDALTDFAGPAVVGDGIHSANAYSPTNFVLPLYPNPAAGVLLAVAPTPDWTFKAGLYDGAGWTGVDTGSRWPKTFFGSPSDTFLVGQVDCRWALGRTQLAGGFNVGAWYHSGTFERPAVGGEQAAAVGTFASFDQELDHSDEGGHVSSTTVVLQAGVAEADVAPYDLHGAAGVCWKGPFRARPDDSLGLYASWLHFGDDPAFTETSETAFEAYYRWSIRDGVVLEPDLQYIANPGGDASVDDAVVFALRLQLDF